MLFAVTRSISHKAPSAKRCIKTVDNMIVIATVVEPSHKAPSAKRCIKTWRECRWGSPRLRCHKAPSAKRCIKTYRQREYRETPGAVIKHRAPNGALRRQNQNPNALTSPVIKHRAPNGALRPPMPTDLDNLTALRS